MNAETKSTGAQAVECEPICFERQFEEELDAVRRGRGSQDDIPSDEERTKPGDSPEKAYRAAHGMALLGLAFSGGGIRSATFNLGVIQKLAKLGLLHRVDYLSTVSGGGYIGSWLSAWVHRKQDFVSPIRAVEDSLAPRPGNAAGAGPGEPKEVSSLREFSNYLTPRVGALSIDTLTGVATYLRNLLLNQTILTALVLGLLLLPWAVLAQIGTRDSDWVGLVSAAGWIALLAALLTGAIRTFPIERIKFGFRSHSWVVFVALVLASVFLGIAGARDPSFMQENWAALSAAYGLTAALGWLLGYRLEAPEDRVKLSPWAVGSPVIAGLVSALFLGALLLGWLEVVEPESTLSPLIALLFGPLAMLGVLLLTVTLHIGLASRQLREGAREAWNRQAAYQFRFALVWLAFVGAALFGPLLLIWLQDWVVALGGLTWVASTLGGVLVGYKGIPLGKRSAGVQSAIAAVAPYIFVAGLLLAASYGTYRIIWSDWFAELPGSLSSWTVSGGPPGPLSERSGPEAGTANIPETFSERVCAQVDGPALFRFSATGGGRGASGEVTGPAAMPSCSAEVYMANSVQRVGDLGGWKLALFGVLLLVLALALSWRVDINVFSLHMFYRNRIVRCYMGASRAGKDDEAVEDAPMLKDLIQDARQPTPRKELRAAQRPFPIYNAALNITRGSNLAWQERKAASFTFTPMYCGYEISQPSTDGEIKSAYQRTDQYSDQGSGAMSLGLPVTVSGAAASPNAGSRTSFALAFLMTIFNVRLGWWLRNPALCERWKRGGPRLSLHLLLQELLARTTDRSEFIYLSDGGHFENLGVYELVRRRCRYVVVCDAGCDPNYRFEDLGNAVRKCKIDLGIHISIDPAAVRPDPKTGRSAVHCAVGRIHYESTDPKAEPGYLLYIKSSLTGDEPADVLQYAASGNAFPHESTADQWYTESQFESYRALGWHVIDQVIGVMAGAAQTSTGDADLEDLFARLRERWYPALADGRGAAAQHNTALDGILEEIRAEEELRFLLEQIYPEWAHVSGSASERSAGFATRCFPGDAQASEAGFLLCNKLLRLMESVYLDLDLERTFAHPDHRGWMNLFRRWSWVPLVRVVWTVGVGNHGARFQSFCERHLALSPGTVTLKEDPRESAQDTRQFNSVERRQIELLKGVLADSGQAELQVDQFVLGVDGALAANEESDRGISFPFAFGVIGVRDGARTLVFYRVQDHLRNSGLGRKGLEVLYEKEPGLVLADWIEELAEVGPEVLSIDTIKERGDERQSAQTTVADRPAPEHDLAAFSALFTREQRASLRRLWGSVALAQRERLDAGGPGRRGGSS